MTTFYVHVPESAAANNEMFALVMWMLGNPKQNRDLLESFWGFKLRSGVGD